VLRVKGIWWCVPAAVLCGCRTYLQCLLLPQQLHLLGIELIDLLLQVNHLAAQHTLSLETQARGGQGQGEMGTGCVRV